MTLVTLRPNATTSNTGALTGGASAHAVLSDNSDASYVTYDPGEESLVPLGDLTLPAGALIDTVQIRARLARDVPTPDVGAQIFVSVLDSAGMTLVAGGWAYPTGATPTTYVIGSPVTGRTDAQLDDARLKLTAYFGNGPVVRGYEGYLDVRYIIQPVVNVTAPTGTITTTNTPLVTWTNTFDPEGLWAYQQFQVRIFSAAQYGAGGFDPSTSTATAESGYVAPSAANAFGTQWQSAVILPNATYRAYVRVGQQIGGGEGGSTLWSAWDFEQFTINVTPPSPPSLTAVAQSAQGRIKLTLDDNGAVSSDRFELQRTIDGGATWKQVRIHDTIDLLGSPGIIIPLSTAAFDVYDYEAPNGVQTGYRARALHNYSGVYAASSWTSTQTATWTSIGWWLKDPVRPALNMILTGRVFEVGDVVRRARQGVFQALGATLPIVVSDTRAGPAGTITLQLQSVAEQTQLAALLAAGPVLLVQGPVEHGHPDRYVVFGDHSQARLRLPPRKIWTRETLPFNEVAATIDPQTGAQLP